jgi:hypothetical protein
VNDALEGETLVLPAVLRLLADYGRMIDTRECDSWSRLFAVDGVLRYGPHEFTGTVELAKFAAASPPGVHLTGVPSVRVGPDGGVHATSAFVFVSSTERQVLAGGYRDRFVSTDEGRLVFSRREIELSGRITL